MYLSDLRTDARYHVSPQLTINDYSDAEVDRNLNHWYKEIGAWIIGSEGEWELRGDILTRDFQAGVTQYQVPRNFFRIYKCEVMYTAAGSFVPVDFINVQANQGSVEGNASRSRDDVSSPTAELFGDIVDIRPSIAVGQPDVVNGIKLWAQIDFQDLVNAHDIPDLMEPVQRGISVGAAMDFCLAEEMYTKYRELKKRLYGDPSLVSEDGSPDKGIRGLVEKLYSVRAGVHRDQIAARRRSYR